MYTGTFIYPTYYSISEIPTSLKFNSLMCAPITKLNDALKLHTHTGGNDGTVIGANGIANLAISTEKLIDESVTNVKLGQGAVTTEKIADEVITTNKIINAAVTTDKINNYAITGQKIASAVITNTHLTDSAVGAGKLAPSAGWLWADRQTSYISFGPFGVVNYDSGSQANPYCVTTGDSQNVYVCSSDLNDITLIIPIRLPHGSYIKTLRSLWKVYDGTSGGSITLRRESTTAGAGNAPVNILGSSASSTNGVATNIDDTLDESSPYVYVSNVWHYYIIVSLIPSQNNMNVQFGGGYVSYQIMRPIP